MPPATGQPRRPRRPAPQPATPRAAGLWELQLLGALRGCNGDWPLAALPTRQVTLLLARLALQLQRDHPRDELAELLWPSEAEGKRLTLSQQRSRLRTALHALRKALEPAGHSAGQVLITDARHARLNAALVRTDVDAFEQLCSQAAHDAQAAQAARLLYRGELLPGLHDDWLQHRRQQLARLYEALQPGGNEGAAEPSPRLQAVRTAQPGFAGAAAGRVTAAGARHRLPGYVTPFFGRQEEITRLAALLLQHRLVQVLGPGGCGKTRLAVQWALQDIHFDTILLVPLQECGTSAAVVDQLRATLALQATPAPALEQVINRLQGSRTLLILDCCEHLLPAARPRDAATAASAGAHADADANARTDARAHAGGQAGGQAGAGAPAAGQVATPRPGTLHAFVHTLLKRLPQLQLLLTSRRALLTHSPRLTLQPLQVPDSASTPAQAMASTSVRLFVDRARGVRSDFTLHARNVRPVVEVCRLLDGLPALIEIAASRVRHAPPQALAAALAGSLALLQRTGPQAARAGHHRSGQALLDWSWQQLTPPLRAMLAAVVAFRGGWTLQAAAAVASCSLTDCANRLQALAEHHLVACAIDAQGNARWHMLGVVRELVQAWVPPAQAAVHRSRLREHLLAWAEGLQACHAPFSGEEAQNTEAALASALADGDGASGIALALALQWPWVAGGATLPMLASLDALVPHLPALPSEPDNAVVQAAFHALRARLLLLAGSGQRAQQAAELAVQCAGKLGAARADALQALTSVRWRREGDPQTTLPAARRVLRLARAYSPPHAQARAAVLLGAMLVTQGGASLPEATRLFVQAKDLLTTAGDEGGALAAMPGFITCLAKTRRHAEAAAQAQACLLRAQQLGLVETQLLLLNRLSQACAALRRHRAAVQANQQQLALARHHGLAYHQAYAVWNMALSLSLLGHTRQAVPLMAFAEVWWTRDYGALTPADRAALERLRRRAERQLGAANTCALWAQGVAMTPAQALALAATA